MKKHALTAAVLTLTAGVAQAGGLDRSGTSIDALFASGNYAEISLGFTMPDVTGNDVLSNRYSNVADDFALLGAALKMDIGEKLSFALIFDQPYGSDVVYDGNPATTMLGGTVADAESNALTGLLRYKFSDRISVFGGPRFLKAKGEVTLSGLAYGPLNGYNVRFASDEGFGYVAGAAFEIPDIALRAALIYHSSIDMDFNTTDSLGLSAGNTSTELPQSLELNLQSGIAQDTLVFGSIRWSDWTSFTLTPPTGGVVPNLAELDDSYTFELGIGRRFSEKFSARIAASLETKGSDSLVSPLAPVNGQKAVTIGGKYKINDSVDISAGVRYTWLGNARPETGTPDVARGSFRNNNAISVGVKLGFSF